MVVVNARLTLVAPQFENALQEFEVKISDNRSQCESSSGPPVGSSAGAGLAGMTLPQTTAPQTPAPKPQPTMRTLKREESISDHEAAEQIACDTKTAFEKGWLIGGDKRSSNSVEFWMKAMLAHIQSLKRKYKGEADFVVELDSYASMYWKFVCTRILDVAEWSQAQPLGKILEVVQQEFGSLLSPLGQSVVLLLSKGGNEEEINFPDMALAARMEFFRSNDEGRPQCHKWSSVEIASN
jgi:hypothetical protein